MARNVYKLIIPILLLISCGESDVPKPKTGLEYTPVAFADIKGWNNDDLQEAFHALHYYTVR